MPRSKLSNHIAVPLHAVATSQLPSTALTATRPALPATQRALSSDKPAQRVPRHSLGTVGTRAMPRIDTEALQPSPTIDDALEPSPTIDDALEPSPTTEADGSPAPLAPPGPPHLSLSSLQTVPQSERKGEVADTSTSDTERTSSGDDGHTDSSEDNDEHEEDSHSVTGVQGSPVVGDSGEAAANAGTVTAVSAEAAAAEEARVLIDCRHDCKCEHPSWSQKKDVSRNRRKHEERAHHHRCMSAGYHTGLCPKVAKTLKAGTTRTVRVNKKMDDAKAGYQVYEETRVRNMKGQLAKKQDIIDTFGLHTMQHYDLDENEVLLKERIEERIQALKDAGEEQPDFRPIQAEAYWEAEQQAQREQEEEDEPASQLSGSRFERDSTGSSIPRALSFSDSLGPTEAVVRLPILRLGAIDQDDNLCLPIVFDPRVQQALATSRAGAVILSVPPKFIPTQCGVAKLAEHEQYHLIPTSHSEQTLTVLGTDSDVTYDGQGERSKERPLSSEVEFYEQADNVLHRRVSPARVAHYTSALEMVVRVTAEFSEEQRIGLEGVLWGKAVDCSDELEPFISGEKTEKSVSLYARILLFTVPHPFNPHLFTAHYNSLLQLLLHSVEDHPDVARAVIWNRVMDVKCAAGAYDERDSEFTKAALKAKRKVESGHVLGIQFAGLASPMSYLKWLENFFKGHLEQLAASSYNRCDGGAQWWIVVPYSETGKMIPLFKELLELHFGIAVTNRPLTKDEVALLPSMLLSRQLFIPPWMFTKHGINFTHHLQQAGQPMVLLGSSFHQGAVDTRAGYSQAEAVNYLDFQWLESNAGGLRVVFEELRWLRDHYVPLLLDRAADIRPCLRELMCDTYMERVAFFVPRVWSLKFFRLLIADLKRACQPAKSDGRAAILDYLSANANLTTADLQIAVVRLQYCIDTLELADVIALYTAAPQDTRAERTALLADHQSARPTRKPAKQGPASAQARTNNVRDAAYATWPTSIFTAATTSSQQETSHTQQSVFSPHQQSPSDPQPSTPKTRAQSTKRKKGDEKQTLGEPQAKKAAVSTEKRGAAGKGDRPNTRSKAHAAADSASDSE